jgi:hypothetical protein
VHVGFEPDHPASAGVLYRVSPDIYPGAVTDQLKMVLIRKVQEVHADADPSVPLTRSTSSLGSRLEVVHETDEEDGSLFAASPLTPAPVSPADVAAERRTETWEELAARQALLGITGYQG